MSDTLQDQVDESGVEVRLDGPVLRVTIRRPERMNAITTPGSEVIADAFEEHATDPSVRVAVLAGEGDSFCTGADLSGGTRLGGKPNPKTLDVAARAAGAITAFPRPVVAAVGGPAAGLGVSLALAADLVVASESSYFLLAFTRIGLMPDGGSTALVAASIGRARAMRMALLAQRLSARAALEAGLIAEVYPDDSFHDEVEELAVAIAQGPSEAYRVTKLAINGATLSDLPQALGRERAGQLALMGSADFAEGVRAFRERRPAVFGASQ